MKISLTQTAFLILLLTASVCAQVPQLISYQGRVGVDGVNFDGSGQFKFALVNAAGTTTYWSNDGSSSAGSEPGTAVTIAVSKGLYAVLLGDATLAHMTIVPATVFTHGDVHLRVWFNDGTNGFQQLAPDRRIAAVGYAMMADNVPDGAITTAKIADGAVTAEKLAAGSIGSTQLASSTVTVNAGTGLSGGGMVPLGGNVTLGNTGVLSLTGGGGITVDAGTGNLTLGSNATSGNTSGAIVARDASGNFSAGTITGTLNGHATTATDFTGTLAGDVTGTQSATTISATTITGKALTGLTSAAGTITTDDSILAAIGKLDGNLGLKSPLTSPTFTGSVTLPAGSTTSAPLKLQSGPSLTNPVFGAVEFDGTNLFVTNNSGSPTRKTIAFTDTPLVNAQIADGSITSSKLAAGAVDSTQLAAGAAAANLNASGQAGVPSGGLVLSTSENPALVNAGYTLVSSTLGTTEWKQRVTTSAPKGRVGHTAVWSGSEMIIWGGSTDSALSDEGGRFNPGTNSWLATSKINAPTPRSGHTAVWGGGQMIIWGGDTGSGASNQGSRYNPLTDTWTAMSTVGAPVARYSHSAVWTGSEFIVWGGYNATYLNSGGRYNPATNTWSPLNTSGAPTGRVEHTAVWTGSEMLVWGGLYYDTIGGTTSWLNSGGRYNPTTDSWTAMTTTSAPEGRYEHATIWTGTEMIVWGGIGDNSVKFNNGGRYNPNSSSWTPLSLAAPPLARYGHSVVWTGAEMIIWGGFDGNSSQLGDGGRYNPTSNAWTQITSAGAPAAREAHSVIWTGTEMLVWGGVRAGPPYLNDLSSYTPGRTLYLYQRP